MAIIGGFDPNLGIAPLRDGRTEIGRTNLPEFTRIIPDSPAERSTALVYQRIGSSGLMERFAPYLGLDLRHRELLAPHVFFETLAAAADSFRRESEEQGQPDEGPLAEAARRMAEVLADRELCETLRNLVIQA